MDARGEVQCATDGVEAIFGYDADELVGESVRKLIPERLRPRYDEAFARLLETDEGADWQHVETRGRHRDGHEVPVEVSFREESKDGERLVTGTIRDISARKTAEVELEASNERYRKLIAACPEAILVADAETGMILDANPAAETLLSRSHDEILDMHHSEIHPKEKPKTCRELFDSHVRRAATGRSRRASRYSATTARRFRSR
ncbi:PAS domain-containing protein [Haladaptatus sp. NG-WS-4]